jgi:hypothetical protein
VEGSRCVESTIDAEWLNPPSTPHLAERRARPHFDETVHDPALERGISLSGRQQRFALHGTGRYLVELFLWNPESDRFPFRLVAGGLVFDEQPLIAPGPGRLRPKRGVRHTSLITVLEGPVEFMLETEAPGYVLSALRWTRIAEFETKWVPKLAERANHLHANILTQASAHSPTARRAWLQHVSDRLAHSRDTRMRDLGLLGRTRAWFWLAAENHEPDDLLQTERLFETGLKIMPENAILRQMISASCSAQVGQRMPRGLYCQGVKPLPWSIDVPTAPAGAPSWAVAQRRLMRRMGALTRWWVEQRQAPNGELGGGWGDDVEILRYWGPQALGFGSEAAAGGIRKLADGLWHSGALLHGYDRAVSDVEHSSEPTTDTQPLLAALDPSDRAVLQRLGETAACSEHWMAPQPDGFLRFRSSWFNCREADLSPARALDVHMNVRAMGPALWYAYLTRDPALTTRIAAWADSWIRAMRDTRHGKPAGVFPSVVRSADGRYLVGSDRWDKPAAEWDYFQWSGGSQEALASLVLAAYSLTGKRTYLDAVGESFRPCERHAEICDAMRSSPEAFYEWRRITGDSKYDAAFGYNPAGDVLERMLEMARATEERFAVNFDIFTSEVLFTDRVYYPLPAEYRWHLFGGESPRGDRYPAFAVTWPAAKAEFARALLTASENEVVFRAYSFESAPATVPVRLWRVRPGRYTWTSGEQSSEFTVDRVPHTVDVSIPVGKEVTVRIAPAGV